MGKRRKMQPELTMLSPPFSRLSEDELVLTLAYTDLSAHTLFWNTSSAFRAALVSPSFLKERLHRGFVKVATTWQPRAGRVSQCRGRLDSGAVLLQVCVRIDPEDAADYIPEGSEDEEKL